jgi:hypothetical protein
LSDTDSWTSFPRFKTDNNGNWRGIVSARIKETEEAGDYLLVVRIRKIDGGNQDSPAYQLAATETGPTPASTHTLIPTSSLTPTAIPTPTLTLTPAIEATASLSPTIFFTETPSAAQAGEVLGKKKTIEVGQSGNRRSRIMAGVLISLGGVLIVIAGFWGGRKNSRINFDKLEKNNERF